MSGINEQKITNKKLKIYQKSSILKEGEIL